MSGCFEDRLTTKEGLVQNAKGYYNRLTLTRHLGDLLKQMGVRGSPGERDEPRKVLLLQRGRETASSREIASTRFYSFDKEGKQLTRRVRESAFWRRETAPSKAKVDSRGQRRRMGVPLVEHQLRR